MCVACATVFAGAMETLKMKAARLCRVAEDLDKAFCSATTKVQQARGSAKTKARAEAKDLEEKAKAAAAEAQAAAEAAAAAEAETASV